MQPANQPYALMIDRRQAPRSEYQPPRIADKLQRRVSVSKVLKPLYYVVSVLLIIYLAFIQPIVLRNERDKVEADLRKELKETRDLLIQATPLTPRSTLPAAP